MCSASIELRIAALALLALSCDERPVPIASVRAEPATLRLEQGTCATIRLRWTALRALEGRQVVFVHLYDGKKIVRTYDHEANWPFTPGTSWIEEIEICHSLLAPPVPPGSYTLRIGLYDGASGSRIPLHVDADEVARRAYKVAGVDVAAPRPTPALHYRGSWSPVRRQSGDGQIPAVRWLHRSGEILVRGGAGSRLHLGLHLYDAPLLLTHRGITHLLGTGRQTWHVPLAAEEEVISFAPAKATGPRGRTVTIEHVAFHP